MTDLSANIKFQSPFFKKNKYLPKFAVGLQDISGGASHFTNKYFVMSQGIWRFRFSLGYGISDYRMNGVFGGAEVKLFDWAYLLGEYDARETNVGIRLITPKDLFSFPLDIGFTAKTSLDYKPGSFDFALMLQFPLGFDHHDSEPLPEEEAKELKAAQKASEKAAETAPEEKMPAEIKPAEKTPEEKMHREKTPRAEPAERAQGRDAVIRTSLPYKAEMTDIAGDTDKQLLKLKERLIYLGFENVRVGVKDRTILYLEYENNRYNHNQLDGLGLVLGVAVTMSPPELVSFIAVMKEVNIPMIELRAPMQAYRYFLSDLEPIKFSVMKYFLQELKITQDISTSDYEGVRFVGGDDNSSQFKTRLIIDPGLQTHVGTEVGVFDWLLSVNPDALLNVWKGGVINARWNIPVVWSTNYDDRKTFRNDRKDAHMERLLLQQAFKIVPTVMTQFSGGMYLENNNGIMNETVWTPGIGQHRFKLTTGYLRDTNLESDRKIYLGSYRYYYDELDLSFEATYGQYVYQDSGITLEMKRFFGDTAISLFYMDCGSRPGDRAVGIRIALPLTPRRDMKPSYLQVKGPDAWSHQVRIAAVSEGIGPYKRNLTVIPQTTNSLDQAYYNRDRLSELYIKKHLLRLRDAYATWGVEKGEKDE